MNPLIVMKIDRWWYIKHSPRCKFFKYKYYGEEDCRLDAADLKAAWDKTPGLEHYQVTNDFNVGHGSCEPAQMRSHR